MSNKLVSLECFSGNIVFRSVATYAGRRQTTALPVSHTVFSLNRDKDGDLRMGQRANLQCDKHHPRASASLLTSEGTTHPM